MSKLVLLGFASSLAAGGFAAISVAQTPLILGGVVLLTGLAISPMAPTALSVAGDRYERNTGAVFGLMLSLGQLGGMIIPWSVARVASAAGFRSCHPRVGGVRCGDDAAHLGARAEDAPRRRTGRRAPMMTAAAVLFDLDGTLIDTTELILASCRHTFDRHLKGGCPPREALIATFGRSLPESLLEAAVAEGAADPHDLAARMLATYRAHNDEHHDALIRPFQASSRCSPRCAHQECASAW